MNSHNPTLFLDRSRPAARDTQVTADYRHVSVRTLTSQSLFQGAYEIGIDHGGALYRLKITRQGKLILNK